MTERDQFDAWWASHRQGRATEKPFAWLVWQAARTQSHQTEAAIERKDALLRQALEVMTSVNTAMPFPIAEALRRAITKELGQ